MDRFLILEEIGRGVHGIVYKGIDHNVKTEVAIKKMDKYIGLKEVNNLKLVQNLDIVSGSSRCPTDIIPKYICHFHHDDKIFIVEELIKGKTLFDIWKIKKDWDFVWLCLYHIFETTKILHDKGFSHGDLYSKNMIWTGEKLIIIDFDSLTYINDKALSRDYYLIFGDISHEALLINMTEAFNINHGLEKYTVLRNFIINTYKEKTLSYYMIMDKYNGLNTIKL